MYYHDGDATNIRPTLIVLKTTIQTTFGVLVGDTVVKEIPLSVGVEKLDPTLFSKAADVLLEHRTKLQAELDTKGYQ
jgi:uncharacterized protein YybS (DUF2232 family)